MQALKDLDFNFNQKLQSAEKSKLYLEQNINPKLVFENLFKSPPGQSWHRPLLRNRQCWLRQHN